MAPRPSEHRTCDARGDQDVRDQVGKKVVRLRTGQGERGASQERGGGNCGDGAHTPPQCKRSTADSTQRTQRTQRSETKRFCLCVLRVLCVRSAWEVRSSCRGSKPSPLQFLRSSPATRGRRGPAP